MLDCTLAFSSVSENTPSRASTVIGRPQSCRSI